MTYLPSSAAAASTGSAGSQAVSAAPGGHGHQMMHHLLHHSAAGQQGGATNGTGRKARGHMLNYEPFHLCREYFVLCIAIWQTLKLALTESIYLLQPDTWVVLCQELLKLKMSLK